MPSFEVAGANFVITIQEFSIAAEGFSVAASESELQNRDVLNRGGRVERHGSEVWNRISRLFHRDFCCVNL